MNADSFVNGRWGNCGVLGPAFLTEWCYLCDHAHLLSLIVYPWPCQTEHGERYVGVSSFGREG